MAFLPQELARAQERLWVLELPSNDVVPLIELVGQVAVRLNPLGERRIHASLARRTDGDVLGQVTRARFGHPGDLDKRDGSTIARFSTRADRKCQSNLRREIIDVVLFAFEGTARDENGKVTILDSQLSYLAVEVLLDLLPNEV